MIDEQVLKAQKWVNETYSGRSGFVRVVEDGLTGFDTIYGLIRALQIELGITALSSTFGPTTMTKLEAYGPISSKTSNANIVKIMQSALYCKGYDGSDISGKFDARTGSAVQLLQVGIGYAPSETTVSVSPKLFKALLTMDAFVKLPEGSEAVRTAQQWMNVKYINRRDFTYMPTDGIYSRGVQTALMYALQYEINMVDGTANGNFGPGTQAGLKTAAANVTVGSTDSAKNFVRLFKAALIFNRQTVTFDGQFTASTRATVTAFQRFAGFANIDQTGRADYRTWAELLISTGDTSRPGTAFDCVTNINTPARAQALKALGYRTVGRYITGDLANSTDNSAAGKRLKPAELQNIFANGMSVFPIYQEDGRSEVFFTYNEGFRQGGVAHARSLEYGFPRGTIVYFGVDFDATGEQISSSVVNYFRGVAESIAKAGGHIRVGVYGSRNICAQVSAAGHAVSSFVSGMSYGFSGNLGFPLPSNWAFNQVLEYSVQADGSTFGIDKDIMSGRDLGISSLTEPIETTQVFLDYLLWLQDAASTYKASHPDAPSANRLVLQYLRRTEYNDPTWWPVVGLADAGFASYVDARGVTEQTTFREPNTYLFMRADHIAVGIEAVLAQGVVSDLRDVNLADLGGWAGDLVQTMANYWNEGRGKTAPYDFAKAWVGGRQSGNLFNIEDYILDADGMQIGLQLLSSGGTVADAFRSHYRSSGTWKKRYARFYASRFSSNAATLLKAARIVTGAELNSSALFVAFRTGLLVRDAQTAVGAFTVTEAAELARGFSDKLLDSISKE